MSSICTDSSCWTILVVVLIGIAGQAGFIWWSHRRAQRQWDDARRQVRKDQAKLIDDAFDNMPKGKQ